MTGPAAKRIRLRWRGACAVCARELAQGSYAWHQAGTRALLCDDCAVIDAPADGGVAGASAQREYERRHRAREDRVRRVLGGLGVAIARVSGDPQHIRSWKQGAEGERKLAARLEKLTAGKGVLYLHDRRIAGTRTNIDHLAIGPGGVTVIDAKDVRGKIRRDWSVGLLAPRRHQLLIAGRDRTHLITGLRRQLDAVSAALADLGREGVPVRGALCLLDPSGLPWFGTVTVDGLPVIGVRTAAALIVQGDERAVPDPVALHAALAVRLPRA